MCSRRGRRDYKNKSRQRDLSLADIEQLLGQLTDEGILRQDVGDDGETRYGLTDMGRCVARMSKKEPS